MKSLEGFLIRFLMESLEEHLMIFLEEILTELLEKSIEELLIESLEEFHVKSQKKLLMETRGSPDEIPRKTLIKALRLLLKESL